MDKAKILAVDDNPAVLRLLSSLFEEHGIDVVLASSVAEAKQALADHQWQFDLVLSDISMPVETGFDLLTWLKGPESKNRDLPVLLTTAQLPEAEHRLKGLALGAVDYVVRPIDLGELVLRTMHAVDNFRRVRSLEASLQDSEDLAMVGRLLAASHHEIKNLAALVSLATSQAVRLFAGEANGQGREVLSALEKSVNLLTDVSRNVSNLLKPSQNPPRATDALRLIREVVSLMQARVSACRLAVDLPDGELWVLAHDTRLKQILINLILNAHDATVELAPDEGGLISISCRAEQDAVLLSVKDNGIGFAPPALRTDFAPFATTKKLRGGQGLGLWLCASLTAGMQGRLQLASKGVGQGAEASLLLKSTPPPEPELDISQYFTDEEE